MATSLAFGLGATTLIVLILVPVMYSFFGTSAREEEVEEFAEGVEPGVGEAEQEGDWLPESEAVAAK
jgi:hypothetical protein